MQLVATLHSETAIRVWKIEDRRKLELSNQYNFILGRIVAELFLNSNIFGLKETAAMIKSKNQTIIHSDINEKI